MMQVKRGNLKPVYGTVREQRFPRQLAPDSTPLDERTYADQMSFALEFAKLLTYYDESNQPAANWSAFFERDLAFLLARIVTTDFQSERFQAGALQMAAQSGRKNTKEILNAIYRMISRIDRWYRWAADIAGKDLVDNALRMTLKSIIQSDLSQYLGENIAGILQRLPHASGSEPWSSYWSRRESQLDQIWREPQEGAPSYPPAVGVGPVDDLIEILHGVHHANLKLLQVAHQYLDEMMGQRSNHPPHTALYIAFAKLLDLLRGKINGMAGRHLDFYYRDVLGLTERGIFPDVVHLSFEAAPQVNGYLLPAGTRLAAGKDPNGAVREFATDSDLFINRARIESLKALYLARDRFATSSHAPQRITSVLALPRSNSQDGMGEALRDPTAGWPTFGVNETVGDPADRPQLNAEMGFVAASPALLLQEGERNVKIRIAFSGENSLESTLQAYQDVACDILDEPPAIELLLADAFSFSLSGEKGWMAVTQAAYRRHPVVGSALEIEFTLQSTDPPVVANATLAPEPQRGQWPMFKLMLNPLARIYAYSFFKDLAIETIDLQVSVRGIKKMQLRNDVGLLNAAQPFPIFGPAPAVGSYLLLSHEELAVKRVTSVAITVSWFNLPKPPASLASYYAAYNLGITDDSFKVRVSVFGSDAWTSPSAGHDVFPLFTRDYDRSGLLPATALAFTPPELPPPAAQPPAAELLTAPLLSETEAPRGSIRLELAEPEFGFGQSVFPRVMAQAALANTLAGKKDPQTPLPNPPLVPAARSLLLDYEAADRLDLSRPLPEAQPARFYSLCPFGYIGHQGRAVKFPNYREQGHLRLGIAEVGPLQSLTLLFQMIDAGFSPVPSVRSHHDAPVPPLRWRYLSRNQWKDFPNRLVIADSTMGLTRSGIIKFQLPEDITADNTLMPAGLCWMEAAAEQVAGAYWCNVVSIATQAVTASRICGPQSELVPAVLPAGSVTQFSEKKPQIKTITQPFASSGGRGKEDLKEFRTRVSERLRHKGRAIQKFDFERLILDRFHDVGQVKCIGHNDSRAFPNVGTLNPGMLYLVAVPRLENCPDLEPRLPQFVLRQIEEFIKPLTSVFVTDIHVINPVYETLKVFANVEFIGDGDASYYSDDLDVAISEYLQPWRHTPPQPMYIGSGRVQGYELAKFIQQRPYVRQLQKLAMLHTYQTENGYFSEWRSVEQRVWASSPWAVLIPAANHGIVAVGPGASDLDEGVRNLTVGADLVMNQTETKEKKEKSAEPRYFLVIPRNTVLRAARD